MMNLDGVPGYLTSKMTFHLMGQQAITGFGFDKEKAIPLAEHIKEEMKKIEDEVEPQLPPRPLKKSEENHYTFPAKPFKKDGTLSAHGLNFLERHGLELIGVDHIQWEGELVKITGGKQLPATAKMTLGNQEDIKSFLLESGWSPTLWNYKKDKRGKPVRDKKGKQIRTSPKFHEKGVLCPSLEAMNGDMVKPIVTFLSYKNRLSTLESQANDEKGWLNNPRLDVDGRLPASSTGLAASHRQRHSVICNIPKAEDGVLLGKEFRSLFIPRRDLGHVQVGFDASALEARVEAHYCYKFPGGDTYAYDLLEGDIHLKTAESVFGHKMKGITGTPDFHKDHPLVKPWRSKSKTIRYASAYGAGADKLATTLGVSLQEAKEAHRKFWESAGPLTALKEALTAYWETTGEKKWIKGIDGRKLYSRSAHSLVNLLFQSCGAIIMDYAGIFLNKWLGDIQVDVDGTPGYLYKGHWVYRMTYMHDELQFSCPPEIADEVGTLGVSAIRKAGEFLKMRVPMEGEYIVGRNWAECH